MAKRASTAVMRQNVSERMVSGVTAQKWQEDLDVWLSIVDSLEEYDEDACRVELTGWDMSLPPDDSVDPLDFQETYSRLVAYRERLNYMTDSVRKYADMYALAIKTLEKSAYGLGNGKTQKDKEAFASHLVQPLVAEYNRHGRFLSHLQDWTEVLEYATLQMARILRQYESMSKLSDGHIADGNSATYGRLRRNSAYVLEPWTDQDEETEEKE